MNIDIQSLYMFIYIYIYKGFLEVAIESWPEWDIYITFQINHKSWFTPVKDDREQTIQVSSINVNIYVR